MDVIDLRTVQVPGAPSEYKITARFANNTDVEWTVLNAYIAVSTPAYPDREHDGTYISPPVDTVRPGEQMPLEGDIFLWPDNLRIAQAWWEPMNEYIWPNVVGPWQWC